MFTWPRVLLRTSSVATLLLVANVTLADTFVVEIIGYGGRVDQTLGTYALEREANEVAAQWETESRARGDLRLSRVRRIKGGSNLADDLDKTIDQGGDAIKWYNQAANEISDLLDDSPPGTPRGAGQALRDFRDRLEDAFERVTNLKNTLTGGTRRLADQQFAQINGLIDKYNRQASEYNAQASTAGLSRLPQISRVPRQDVSGEGSAVGDFGYGQYTVWVYQLQGGRWLKQESRTRHTDDEEWARSYVADVKRYSGWTATSNLPERDPATSNRFESSSASPVGTWNDERADLVGNWHGVFIAGSFKETVEMTIRREGDITFTTNEGTGKGTWKLNGDTLEIDNANGVSLKYKLKNGQITGTGTSDGLTWTVTFKKM